MKKIIFLLMLLFATKTYSQNFQKLIFIESKEKYQNSAIVQKFMTTLNINISGHEFIKFKDLMSLTDTLIMKKQSFKSTNIQIDFEDINNFCQKRRFSEMNPNSKIKFDKKYVLIVYSKEKDRNGKSNIIVYTLD